MKTTSNPSSDAAGLGPPRIVQPSRRPGSEHGMLPLGSRLIEAGLIREDQLETALAHQASEEDRLQALAAQEGTESIGRVKRKHFKRLGEVVAELGLVDDIVREPLGSAYRDIDTTARSIKQALVSALEGIEKVGLEQLLEQRYERLMSYGNFIKEEAS